MQKFPSELKFQLKNHAASKTAHFNLYSAHFLREIPHNLSPSEISPISAKILAHFD